MQFARDEGITLRARNGANRRTSGNTPQSAHKPVSDTRYPGKRSVHFMDQDHQTEGQNTLPSEHLMMMNHDFHHHQDAAPSSICTSDLPSTEVSAPRYPPEAEQLLYARSTTAPRINYDDRQSQRNRPGWSTKPELVCYQCYAVGLHISPNCDAELHHVQRIVDNYEKLSSDQRARVPAVAYNMAKQVGQAQKSGLLPAVVNPDSTVPKND